jgi:adenosylmethionine-8-amino-7-oxononanoate aminotransferase
MFACEQEGVEPDLMCLAKGISGGYLPLAATLATEEIYSAFLGAHGEMKHFFHGHTYTANPLACAVGIESLALLRESTLASASALAPLVEAALQRMRSHRHVKEVRQRGMMVGIELKSVEGRFMGREVCEQARAHGVIIRNLGDVVVWMPPLTLTSEDLVLLERSTIQAIDQRFT